MKKLYVLGSIYESINYSFEVDSIISDSKTNDVTVLICDGCIGKCNGNTMGCRILCKECYKRSLSVLKNVSGLRILNTSDFYDKTIDYPHCSYSSIKELNKIVYRGFEIGYGVSSYYISLTRNLNPQITPLLKRILDSWLLSSMKYTDIAEKVMKEAYDMVYVINGRLFDKKPFQEIAFAKGIHIMLGESMIDLSGNKVRMNFDNIRVHSVSGNARAILDFWDESKLPLEERRAIGASFYEKRAAAIATNDKIYVKNQKIGLLPDDWNSGMVNIAIFNSSEDEFAAIGGEIEKNNLFDSQYAGIEYLLENTKDSNIHYYLRIHPNLMNIPYKYHTDLYKLPERFNNITVIPGNSAISSYSLMNACDRIITFGSTMGVEAAYAGKSAMVMRPCFYYRLNVNFEPRTKQEVMNFVNGLVSFEPNRENALKYSYYYYNGERDTIHNKECERLRFRIRLLNRIYYVEFMNLKCSRHRMKYCAFLRLLNIAFAKCFVPKTEK